MSPKKISSLRRVPGKRNEVIALILSSEVDIPNESTRCLSNLIDRNPRNTFVGAKEARFLWSSWNNWRKWDICSSRVRLKMIILSIKARAKSRNGRNRVSVYL